MVAIYQKNAPLRSMPGSNRDMTRAGIIVMISNKVVGARPFLREFFLKGLTHKSKLELQQILEKVTVSPDGLDINME